MHGKYHKHNNHLPLWCSFVQYYGLIAKMNPIIRNSFLTFTLALSLGCSNGTSVLSDKDCQNNLSKASAHLNEYYIDGNEKGLSLSLSIIDSVFNLCPDNRGQLVSLKITFLTLLKDYDKGFEFVNTLEKERFDKPYKKSMYLKTFKALSFEAKGDIMERDVLFKELSYEIESFVNNNPGDKRAITDLFFTKIRFTSKEVVIEEIDQVQENAEADKDFYVALKESIKFAPKL